MLNKPRKRAKLWGGREGRVDCHWVSLSNHASLVRPNLFTPPAPVGAVRQPPRPLFVRASLKSAVSFLAVGDQRLIALSETAKEPDIKRTPAPLIHLVCRIVKYAVFQSSQGNFQEIHEKRVFPPIPSSRQSVHPRPWRRFANRPDIRPPPPGCQLARVRLNRSHY